MSETVSAETVILKLQQEISGPSDVALGALGRLEAQIQREQGALGRMEQSLALAGAKLAMLAEGSADPRAAAAFERQGAAVSALEEKFREASEMLAIMAQSRVSPEAFSTAKQAAADLATQLDVAKAKLGELAVATGPQVNVDAYRRQAAAVASMGDRIGAQKDKIAGLGETLRKGGEAADQSKVPLAAIAKTAKMLGGEFGASESKGVRLVGLFIKMGPTIGIAVAGILLLTGALVAFGSVVAKGIQGAGAMRDELQELRVAGVTFWNAQRANVSSGLALQETINKVADGSALARDKIKDYAVQLKNARFRGAELETALTAMSTVGVAGGDAMASQFLEAAKSAKFFGTGIDALADRIDKKFGAVAQAKLLGIDVQLQKFHENIAYIFSGADIEPFLRGLHTILGLFDRNTAGAKSMRDMVTKLTEFAIGGFLRIAIAMVKTYIFIKTHQAAWMGLKLVLGVVVVAIGLVLAAIGIVAVAGLALLAPMILGFVAISTAVYAVIFSLRSLFTVYAGWGKALVGVGRAMVDGLVQGLKSAGSAVYSTLMSIVKGAVGGVVDYLRIGSPSGLMRDDVGYQMGMGQAGGLEDSAGDVKAAAIKVSRGAVAGAQFEGGGSGGGGGGGRPIQFYNCSFGEGMSEGIVRQMLMKVLEAESLDAGVPA